MRKAILAAALMAARAAVRVLAARMRPSYATSPRSEERDAAPRAGPVERREAPGVCETPLGGPCDRPARTPTA